MKALVLAIALLTGCSLSYQQVTKRCPTTTLLLGDFVSGGVALAISALKWNAGKHAESLAYTTTGGLIFLSANIAELRACKR